MDAHFLTNKRGPHGTRRIPDVADFVKYIRLQDKPLVELPEDPLRWYHSPYLWEIQEMGAQQQQVMDMQVEEANVDQLVRQTAQHHQVQAQLLRQMVEEQQRLARALLLGSSGSAQGSAQTITNITASVNPTDITNALAPLFQQQGDNIIAAMREGRKGPEVFAMDADDPPDEDPSSRKRGVKKANPKRRVVIHNTTYVTQPGPNTGGQMDIDAAAFAGGGSGPPPPPAPPAGMPEGVRLKPYLEQLVANTQGLLEQQQRLSKLVQDQAIGDQIAQANEFRDTREAMAKLGEAVSDRVSRSVDSSLKALVAAVTAHKTAPDPQVTQLQRDFAKANTRVGELEQQLAQALAFAKKGSEEHQAEVAALSQALQHAEEQQALAASDLMAKVREYEEHGKTLMQRLLEQQSINEENARLIAALQLQRPGGPPTTEEALQAQASAPDGPPPGPDAVPVIAPSPPAFPQNRAAGAEPTAFVDQPSVIAGDPAPVDPVAEFVRSMPRAFKTRLREIMDTGDREELVKLLDGALKSGAIGRMAERQMTPQAMQTHDMVRRRMLELRSRLATLANEQVSVAEKKDVFDLMAMYLKAFEVDRRIRQREGEGLSYRIRRAAGPRPQSERPIPVLPTAEPPPRSGRASGRPSRAQSAAPAVTSGRASGPSRISRKGRGRGGGSSGGAAPQQPEDVKP